MKIHQKLLLKLFGTYYLIITISTFIILTLIGLIPNNLWENYTQGILNNRILIDLFAALAYGLIASVIMIFLSIRSLKMIRANVGEDKWRVFARDSVEFKNSYSEVQAQCVSCISSLKWNILETKEFNDRAQGFTRILGMTSFEKTLNPDFFIIDISEIDNNTIKVNCSIKPHSDVFGYGFNRCEKRLKNLMEGLSSSRLKLTSPSPLHVEDKTVQASEEKIGRSSFEIEGEPNKRYYLLSRLTILIVIIFFLFIYYELSKLSSYFDSNSSKLSFHLIHIFLFTGLILIIFLLNSSIIVHPLVKRRIKIENKIFYYFIGDKLENEIPIENIKGVKLNRYSISRMTPFFIEIGEGFVEKHILIYYTENSKNRKLRIYYTDFLPMNALNSLYHELESMAVNYNFNVIDRSKSFFY